MLSRQTQACYMRYVHLLTDMYYTLSPASRAVVKIFCVCLQASEHLRKLCMQNMVWSYCKKISPEWKHQVGVHRHRSRLVLCNLTLLFVCFTAVKSV